MSLRQRILGAPVFGFLLEWLYRELTGKMTVGFEIRRTQGLPWNAMVVQIGSNDGVSNDPLHSLLRLHKGWRCLFVEPVPYLFERLLKNKGESSRFTFVNRAINDGRPAVFYYVDESAKKDLVNQPEYIDQFGSFDRSLLLSHEGGVLEPYIRSMEVQGITLPGMLAVYEVQEVHILHIDAEGYDAKILRQLDLDRYRPLVIVYEHLHLCDEEKKMCQDFLNPYYDVQVVGCDSVWRLRAGRGLEHGEDGTHCGGI